MGSRVDGSVGTRVVVTSTAAIAGEPGIAEGAIKTGVSRVLAKFGLVSRTSVRNAG